MWPFCSAARKLILDTWLIVECSKTIKFNKFYTVESMSLVIQLQLSITCPHLEFKDCKTRVFRFFLFCFSFSVFLWWQILLGTGWMLWTFLSYDPPSVLLPPLPLKVKSPYLRILLCQEKSYITALVTLVGKTSTRVINTSIRVADNIIWNFTIQNIDRWHNRKVESLRRV